MNTGQIKIKIFQFLELLLGKRVVKNLYTKKCVKIFRKYRIIFIHIPKSGGTSISEELFGKRAGHNTSMEIIEKMGLAEFQSLFSFSVVRNPYDRLVSAYHYARQGGSERGGVRFNPDYNSSLFSDFQTFVSSWLMNQNPQEIDLIFKPQYTFIYDNKGQQLLNWIGKIEDINTIQSFISEKMGRVITFGKLNSSKRKKYQEYYNQKIGDLVSSYYKQDFELLNYKIEEFKN